MERRVLLFVWLVLGVAGCGGSKSIGKVLGWGQAVFVHGASQVPIYFSIYPRGNRIDLALRPDDPHDQGWFLDATLSLNLDSMLDAPGRYPVEEVLKGRMNRRASLGPTPVALTAATSGGGELEVVTNYDYNPNKKSTEDGDLLQSLIVGKIHLHLVDELGQRYELQQGTFSILRSVHFKKDPFLDLGMDLNFGF